MALGTDFSGGDDLDSALREAPSARHALSDAIVRRLQNDPGAIPEFPSYGFNIASIIGSAMSDSMIRQRVLAQCMAEEEVEDAAVNVARSGEEISIAISITDGDGPFDFTVNVSSLGVEAFFPNG